LPKDKTEREAYAQVVGEDGFQLLDALEAPDAPQEARELPMLETLRRTWQRHYERTGTTASAEGEGRTYRVRFKSPQELPPATEGIASPYDAEARYRHKRDTAWTGSMVHVSETCESTAPHLLTHVHTTPATVHEAQCTTPIQQALIEKDVPPREHLVDAAYISAALLVSSREEQDIILRGPTRPSQGWQTQVEGAYGPEQFVVDWDQHQVRCPQGHLSTAWWEHGGGQGSRPIIGQFATQTCAPCPVRAACTRAKQRGRRLGLPPRAEAAAVADARAWYASAEGKAQYAQRAGVEGTLSQGVRTFGLRRTRYRGLPKTHVQHIATAAAINIDRIVAWLDERPRAQTRTSRFAALAPVATLHPDEAAA
jgi:transposase